MVTNCKNCGLPIFHGIAGYAGPQCMCKLVTLPQMFDESMARIVALEAERDQLKAENEALTLRVMAGERQELAELKSAPVVMPEPVGYTTAGMIECIKALPFTGRIGVRVEKTARWNIPLYTDPVYAKQVIDHGCSYGK